MNKNQNENNPFAAPENSQSFTDLKPVRPEKIKFFIKPQPVTFSIIVLLILGYLSITIFPEELVKKIYHFAAIDINTSGIYLVWTPLTSIFFVPSFKAVFSHCLIIYIFGQNLELKKINKKHLIIMLVLVSYFGGIGVYFSNFYGIINLPYPWVSSMFIAYSLVFLYSTMFPKNYIFFRFFIVAIFAAWLSLGAIANYFLIAPIMISMFFGIIMKIKLNKDPVSS